MKSSDIIIFVKVQIKADVKKINTIIFLLLVSAGALSAQQLTQVVKGKIKDRLSSVNLDGAGVKLTALTKDYSTTTNESGNFSIPVPVGRYKILVSFTGYELFQDELLVVAGKEAIVNITLSQTQTLLKTVEVEGSNINSNISGLQSITIEKTMRIPANFFDPVRAITSYPGVVAANDQNNSIIVRGNSPNGLLWRLDGLDIVNPNHLSNAGTLSDRPAANGGGVNILSAQMLDRTDFYMAAFPSSYGNALAGVIDMKLRDGNKSKHEYTAQASLIGLDFSAEGPLGKNENSSFVANYRYSTVGLLSAIGVNFGDEAIAFQDFSFHASVDQKNGGNVSFFGLWGKSKNIFNAKDTVEWEEDKDKYDINYGAQTYALGINYQVPIAKGKFSLGTAYSNSDQDRDANISPLVSANDRYLLSDQYQSINGILSTTVNYEVKTGDKSSLELGMMTNFLNNKVNVYRAFGCFTCSFIETQSLNGDADGILLQPYANFTTSLSSTVNLNTGVRYLNYTYNGANALEPRIGLSFKTSDVSGLNIAYSLVSQLQLPQVYLTNGNNDLGFTRSHHMDIDYWKILGDGLKLKSGIFYQSLFDVPIEQNTSSTFSVINLMEALPPVNLVNEGTGENYGVNLTVEKHFFASNYLLLGGSYYESKYTAADGIKRNSRFNGNYTFNAIYGKEWTKLSKNRTIGLNTRLLYLGGLRESAVDVPASKNSSETVYNNTDPYSNKLPDYFRVDVRLSFRKNKPGYTRTFALDIQNLSGQQNESYHYYDMTQQKIVTKFQLGIIPILVYRIDF